MAKSAASDEEAAHLERVSTYYGRAADRWQAPAGERAYDNLGYWAAKPEAFAQAGFRLLEAVATRAQVGADDDVLDVGCGYGASSLDLAGRWGCRSVVGIDVTEPMLAAARRQAERDGLDGRVSFRTASATAIDGPDGGFSRVLAVDCACLFATRERFFREAFRLLRPGGVLGIADALAGGAPRRLWQRLLVTGLARYWNIPAANRYDLPGYRARLAAAGFAGIEAERIGADVFPGAAACAAGAAFRRAERAATGRVAAALTVWALRLAASAHRAGLVDYALVVAHKPGLELS